MLLAISYNFSLITHTPRKSFDCHITCHPSDGLSLIDRGLRFVWQGPGKPRPSRGFQINQSQLISVNSTPLTSHFPICTKAHKGMHIIALSLAMLAHAHLWHLNRRSLSSHLQARRSGSITLILPASSLAVRAFLLAPEAFGLALPQLPQPFLRGLCGCTLACPDSRSSPHLQFSVVPKQLAACMQHMLLLTAAPPDSS